MESDGEEETGRWQIGDGYQERTRPLQSVPTVQVMRTGPRGHPPPRPAPPGRRVRRDPVGTATRWLTLLVLGLTAVVMVLGTMLLNREVSDPLDVERLEDRLDQLDSTVVQWTAEDLPAPQKSALETRVTHLSESLCRELERNRDGLPEHLVRALEDVCGR